MKFPQFSQQVIAALQFGQSFGDIDQAQVH